MAEDWACPYCGRLETIAIKDIESTYLDLNLENADGRLHLITRYVVCPNPECRRVSIEAKLYKGTTINYRTIWNEEVKSWRLWPTD